MNLRRSRMWGKSFLFHFALSKTITPLTWCIRKHIVHLHNFLSILNKIVKTLQNQHVLLKDSVLKKPWIYYWSRSFDSSLTKDLIRYLCRRTTRRMCWQSKHCGIVSWNQHWWLRLQFCWLQALLPTSPLRPLSRNFPRCQLQSQDDPVNLSRAPSSRSQSLHVSWPRLFVTPNPFASSTMLITW